MRRAQTLAANGRGDVARAIELKPSLQPELAAEINRLKDLDAVSVAVPGSASDDLLRGTFDSVGEGRIRSVLIFAGSPHRGFLPYAPQAP